MWIFLLITQLGCRELVCFEGPLVIFQRLALAMTPQYHLSFYQFHEIRDLSLKQTKMPNLVNVPSAIGINGSGDSPEGNWRNQPSALVGRWELP
ncbi:hypothetical protein H920_00410 [Fukomys damarensis]|uniref:Uncharacterized protein n=1 Tax=Fukomys damarensis TaxID=885580 RepID=A0A091E4C3_FUKDA|nr:hypothetical protein H920_00410 [Fukomys damarensis]